jgi:uncharacterized membrane protein
MIVPIPYVHMAIGALIVVLAVPLLLRRVPMNHAYGVRVREAFVSQSNWYAINAFGGKCLLAVGLLLLAVGYFGRAFAPSPRSAWAPVYLLVPLLVLIPAVAVIKSYARWLPNR